MLSELGFYILFIFKLFLIGVLSLIINYLYKDKLQRDYRSNRVPLGRWGEPSDIASSILFMLSEDASYITGSSLLVDGGVMAGELSRPANPLQDSD